MVMYMNLDFKIFYVFHQVVELQKKVSKMEIQLRKRGEDGNAKAGISCMGGVDNEAVTDIGVALSEEPPLEQYQNDIAHRKVSVSSFGGSEVSGNDNEYRRNEPCSFSSRESYSPCRHSSSVRRHYIREFQNSSRVKKSPLRCLEKKDKLPVSMNNDSNGSHQTAQWLHDTTRFGLSSVPCPNVYYAIYIYIDIYIDRYIYI